MPKISVIIPTYNCAKYLSEALDSVFCQTYRDFEVIVVDDGSTDNTQEVLDAHRDYIRYVRQERGGPSAARNRGASLAAGEFIVFLDADDLLLPHCLSVSICVADSYPSFGAVFHNSIKIPMGQSWTEDGIGHWEVSGSWGQLQKHALLMPTTVPEVWMARAAYFSLLLSNFPDMNGTTVSRPLFLELGGFHEKLNMGEDRDLWLRIALRGAIFLCKTPGAVYRRRRGSLVERREVYFRSSIRTPESNYNPGLLTPLQKRRFVRGRRKRYAEYGQFLLESNRLRECKRLMRKCRGKWGVNRMGIRLLLLSSLGASLLDFLRSMKGKLKGGCGFTPPSRNPTQCAAETVSGRQKGIDVWTL